MLRGRLHIRRCLPALCAGAAGAALLAPAGAPAAEQRIEVPTRTGISQPPPAGFRDRVFHGGARAARARAAVSGGYYTSPDGYRVLVEVSESYVPSDADNQALVDFLAANLHGSELGRLRVLVLTPEEVSRACGGGAETLACYDANASRMFIPGERSSAAGDPAYSITHEYGHHIANHRRNSPWPALDYGTKRWATYERVCKGVRLGLFFPGNQGRRYLDDPGEAFADSYAQLNAANGRIPRERYQYNRLLAPTEGSFVRIRRDVLRPWAGARFQRFRGRLGGGDDVDTFRVPIGLDGSVAVRLAGPRGTNFDLRLRKRGRTVKRTRRRGSRDRLRYRWCRRSGPETVAIRVVRRRGSGRYRIRVSWPG